MGSRQSVAAVAVCTLAASYLPGDAAVLRAGRRAARQPDVEAYENLIQQPSLGSLFAGATYDNLVKGLSSPGAAPAPAPGAAPAPARFATMVAPGPAAPSSAPSGGPSLSGGGSGTSGGSLGSQVVTVQYAVEGDYDTVVGSQKALFLQECTATASAVASVVCSDVRAGSIVVDFTGNAQSANTAVQSIETSPTRSLSLPSFAALPAVGVISTVAASPTAVAAFTSKYPEQANQVPNINDIPFLVNPFAPYPAPAPADPMYQALADHLLVPPPLPGQVFPAIPILPKDEDIPVPPVPPPDPPAKPLPPPDPPAEGALVPGPPPGPVIEGEQPSSISATGEGATMLVNTVNKCCR